MAGSHYVFGRFKFDQQRLTLYEGERVVALTSRCAEILALLLERPGEVIGKEEFIERVWKSTFVEQRNLTQSIFLLRRALGEEEAQTYIETVAKRGYRFAAAVEKVEGPLMVAAATGERRRLRRWLVAGLAAALVMAGCAGLVWMLSPEPRPVLEASMKRLTWAGVAHEPDISPDGRFIAYVAEDPATSHFAIFRLDLESRTTRVLTPYSEVPLESPAISSDGKWVAYRSGEGDGKIMLVASGGSQPPVPLADSSRGRQPRWQPGRPVVAYWVATEEHSRSFGHVFRQNISPGGKPLRLFDGFNTAMAPLWADDGSAVLALGTWQSGVAEREFDAWAYDVHNGTPGEDPTPVGLFPLLKKRGLYVTVRDRTRITVSAWRNGFLYLSIYTGSSSNLFRVAVGRDLKVHGEPEELSFGATLLSSPRVSTEGLMVFSSATLTQNPARLSFDGTRLEPLAMAQGWLSRVSVARDGSLTVAEEYTPCEPVRIVAGPSNSFASEVIVSGSVAFPVVSPDGSEVAWRQMDGVKQAIDVMRRTGRVRRRVCADCGAPEEWAADGRGIFYHTGDALARIGVVDIATGNSHDWIQHPDFSVLGPRLSVAPGRDPWVVFFAENTPRTRQIFAVPASSRNVSPPPDKWIPITDGTSWDSSPVWSPDGNTIYFVSQRDGHRCIYAQAVDPQTRRPLGAPHAVRHFHSYAQSLASVNLARASENLRVASDGIYLIPDDLSANIWSLQLKR